jgi:hypothetical protein
MVRLVREFGVTDKMGPGSAENPEHGFPSGGPGRSRDQTKPSFLNSACPFT